MGSITNCIFLDKDDMHRLINEFLKTMPTMGDDDVLLLSQSINDMECKITIVVPK